MSFLTRRDSSGYLGESSLIPGGSERYQKESSLILRDSKRYVGESPLTLGYSKRYLKVSSLTLEESTRGVEGLRFAQKGHIVILVRFTRFFGPHARLAKPQVVLARSGSFEASNISQLVARLNKMGWVFPGGRMRRGCT